MDLRPVRKLERGDDVEGFDCGEPELDIWLRDYAWSDQTSNVSVTYVLLRGDLVIGYYTLAPQSIGRDGESNTRLDGGQPTGRPIPVYLLARLALVKTEQGNRLGGDLLRDALTRCAAGSESYGGRAVLVHAKHEKAATFYQRYRFEPLPENPLHLYLLMKDIRKSLADAAT